MSRIRHPRARSRRSLALPLLAVVAAGTFHLAAAAPANAAVWEDVTCSLAGHPASTEGWAKRFLATPSSGASATNTCATAGALTASDESRGEPQSGGSGAEWAYTTPKGEPIAGGTITVSVYGTYGNAWLSMPEIIEGEGSNTLVSCFFSASCSQEREVPITKHGAEHVYAGAVCVANPETNECRQTGGLNAEVTVSSAKLLLSDNSRPTAAEVTGSILDAAASGTATLSFTANDSEGPGVYGVAVKVDGDPVYQGTPDANAGKCAPVGTAPEGSRQFEATQPCPQSVPVSVQVPTGGFANGQHTLTIEAEDAAGVTAVVYSAPITIANVVPPVSSPFTTPPSPRGAANGTPASEQATLTASWVTHGAKESSTAHLATHYGHGQTVTGKLTSSAGVPIVGAAIEVSETAASIGAVSHTLTVARTAADGTFTATLPSTLTSGTITLAYRSHLGDPSPAAVARLTVSMPAPISLSVGSHVTVWHGTIYFSGKLSGPIPPGGKQVVIEARERGTSWVQFADPTTGAKGKFSTSHWMRFAGPAVYEFRALCKHEADFPFAAGKSRIVSVREV
jgi:hypothetical protein